MKYPERQYVLKDIPLCQTKGCSQMMQGGYHCSWHVVFNDQLVHIATIDQEICEVSYYLRVERAQ